MSQLRIADCGLRIAERSSRPERAENAQNIRSGQGPGRTFAAQACFLLGVLCALCVRPLVLLGATAAPAPAAKWRVETADARLVTGQLVSISADKVVVRTGKGARELALDDVVELSLGDEPDDVMNVAAQAVLQTAQGDALAVTSVSCDGRKLVAAGGAVGRIEVPVHVARALYFPALGRTAAELLKGYEQMELAAASGDRMLVSRTGAQDLAVDGVLERIDEAKVTFRWKEQSRTVARKSVPMIFLAAVAAVADKKSGAIGTLIARDSSRIRFRSLTLAAGKFVIDSPALGKITLPLAEVSLVRLSSDNVVELSDLKPSAVKEYGFFETTFRHRVNKSVAGKPLRLGGREYATGLGLHSYCELTYAIDAAFTSFVAVVGIDDEARPNGDSTVTFIADGKAIGETLHVTGRDEPSSVRLDLRGVKQLIIRVDFGTDGLGIGDHVDIAGARLIK